MEYATLGGSGLSVSRVGFGCAAIGGYDYGTVRDEDSVAAVHAALDLGITLFDTADVYGLGRSEEILARALGKRRTEVVIATKGGVRWDEHGRTTRDLSPGYLTRALEESLTRLGLDCIPLYQLHWPDPGTPVVEAIGALERAREAGKIGAIGVCNFPLPLLEEACAVGRVDTLQAPYSLLEREWEPMLKACRERLGVAVLCYNPLAQGLFTGKYDRHSKFSGSDLRRRSPLFEGERFEEGLRFLDRLRLVAERRGRTPGQIAIRWLLDRPWVATALTGIKTPAQAGENAAATDWNLTPEEGHFLLEGA